MTLSIVEVKTAKQFKQFIHLPAKIHVNQPNWVPPIYLDDKEFFNPQKNRSFDYCDYLLLLAIKNDEVVGRVMGLVNKKYNTSHGVKDARFSFMESYNDLEVADALIKRVEEWAREKGMENLIGPLSFSDKDPQGMMIEGFNETLVIATNCNHPYQPQLLEKMGFEKKVDLVTYKIDIPEIIPPLYQKIYERKLKHDRIKVREFTSTREVKPFVIPVLNLLNVTFKDIYAFEPLEKREMELFASRYLPVLDPRFIKIVENEAGELIAFIISMPDISGGLIKSKGYLFPFGIFQILSSRKSSKQLNLLLGGVKPEYRGTGLDAVLGVKLLTEAHRKGMKLIDSHLVLETNTKMRAELERLGGKIYKRYRIFTKPL